METLYMAQLLLDSRVDLTQGSDHLSNGSAQNLDPLLLARVEVHVKKLQNS
jgi:hypothetical protein